MYIMCSAGNDGKCMHIVYSDNSLGLPMYNTPKETTKYFGYYIDDKSEDSKDPKDYKWEKYEYSEGIE